MKWYRRKQREFVEEAAVDIFGPKQAMKEHFRRTRIRYNGYICYLKANSIMGNEAHERWGALEENEKQKWREIARVKNEEIRIEKEAVCN